MCPDISLCDGMILGDEEIGKSSFAEAVRNYERSNLDSRSIHSSGSINMNIINSDTLDFGGIEFKRKLTYSAGFFIVYNTTSRSSFNSIMDWYRLVCRSQMINLHPHINYEKPASSIKKTGSPKTSNFEFFSRLPVELQLSILEECLISTSPIQNFNLGNNGISLDILLTSKWFYKEGTKIFWEKNKFCGYIPFCIVASKVDPRAQNEIHLEEGMRLAKRLGAIFCDFTSQKQDDVNRAVGNYCAWRDERRGRWDTYPLLHPPSSLPNATVYPWEKRKTWWQKLLHR